MATTKKAPLILSSLSPRPAKLTGWVEDDLSNIVQENGQSLGLKSSQSVRRLLILGLIADGENIQSDVQPRGRK